MARKNPYKVFLSPSNQDDNRYAYGNTTEDVQCGRIAKYCKAALERSGVEVKLEQYDTMANRVAHSNAWKADLHLPIHTNAFNGKVTGTRMFCYSKSGDGYKACKAIYEKLAPLTPGTSENIKVDASLYEVRATWAACAYIEVEFHDNKAAAKWIIENVEAIGEAIAEGACNYLGVKYVKPSTDSTENKQEAEKDDEYYYRVRKAWSDAKSQLGAFAKLDNAKRLADKNPGYYVFDEEGRAIYPEAAKVELKVGDIVEVIDGATVYGSKVDKWDFWVYDSAFYVREVAGDRIVISTRKSGAITGAIHKKYLKKV